MSSDRSVTDTTSGCPAEEGAELRCPQCDYDLRAIASNRCPECGLEIDRADLAQSRIPWTYRARMGRVRAYWKTVWLVVLRPRRLAMEVARPVSLADAKRFQHVTVWLAFIQCVAVLALVMAVRGDFNSWPGMAALRPGVRLGWILEGAALLVWLTCLWLFLWTGSGVSSYFFHPRRVPIETQNRAIAVSYYACAPLPWMILPASGCAILGYFLLTGWDTMPTAEQRILMGIVLAFCALLVLQVAAWWRSSIVLLKRNTGCGLGRVAALAITFPLAWSVFAALFLGVLPLAFIFIALLVLSFQ